MNVVVIKQVTKEKNNRIDVGTTIFSNLNIEIWSLVGEERYGFLHIIWFTSYKFGVIHALYCVKDSSNNIMDKGIKNWQNWIHISELV